MISNNGYCKCKNRIMRSTACIYCPTCQKPFLPADKIAHLVQLLLEKANGRPDGLPDGSIKITAGVGVEYSPKNVQSIEWRTFVDEINGTGAGVFSEILSDPIAEYLGIRAGPPQREEEERGKENPQILTVEDVRQVEDALLKGVDLRGLARSCAVNRRNSMTLLLDALADHVSGRAPIAARNTFDYLLNNEFRRQYSDEVLAFLLFRRGKVRALTGEVNEGISDLDESIQLTDKRDQTRLLDRLRQAAGHAYSLIQAPDIQYPDRWTAMQTYVHKGLDILELSPDATIEQQMTLVEKLEGKNSATTAIGLLFALNMIRAQKYWDSDTKCRETLDYLLELQSKWEDSDPITAWNCLTPLAAEALRLDRLEFAEKALKKAQTYALSNENNPLAVHARYQMKTSGIEWLFHNLQWVVLHMEKAYAARNSDQTKELDRANICLNEIFKADSSPSTMIVLRAAKLYEHEILLMQNANEHALNPTITESYLTPAYSHWTFCPKLPSRDIGFREQ